MSCFAAVAVATISASNCPAGSYWQQLFMTKTLEQFCPAEVLKPMSGPMGTRYDVAISAARQREFEFTAKNRPELSASQIEAEFIAFELRILAQITDGFKSIGCKEMARRLGLAMPELAVTPEVALQVAGAIKIPSTARGNDIPERDRNGTLMDYSLQSIIKVVLQRQHKCGPYSFNVMLLSRNERLAKDPPPFVKPILDVAEL